MLCYSMLLSFIVSVLQVEYVMSCSFCLVTDLET